MARTKTVVGLTTIIKREVEIISSAAVREAILLYMKLSGTPASKLPGYVKLWPKIALTLKFVSKSWKDICCALIVDHPDLFPRLGQKVKKQLEKRDELQALRDTDVVRVTDELVEQYNELTESLDHLFKLEASRAKKAKAKRAKKDPEPKKAEAPIE